MRKGIKKFAVTILLILLISSMAVFFVGCDKDKYPEYEIKLFDDNWNELKKEINRQGEEEYVKIYRYEYDGEIKCFNAIGYNYGKEIYRLDYKKTDFYNDKKVIISIVKSPDIVYKECKTINDLPKGKGRYTVKFHFYVEDDEYNNMSAKVTNYQYVNIIID